MKITLPFPPSANRYWRVYKNRILVSEEARHYKANVKFRAMQDRDIQPLDGPLVVHVVMYRPQRRGDTDNFLKVMLDSLRGVAFNDDSQVVEIHARREDDAENPRVEVRVEELPQ